jgi:hypothetical protein
LCTFDISVSAVFKTMAVPTQLPSWAKDDPDLGKSMRKDIHKQQQQEKEKQSKLISKATSINQTKTDTDESITTEEATEEAEIDDIHHRRSSARATPVSSNRYTDSTDTEDDTEDEDADENETMTTQDQEEEDNRGKLETDDEDSIDISFRTNDTDYDDDDNNNEKTTTTTGTNTNASNGYKSRLLDESVIQEAVMADDDDGEATGSSESTAQTNNSLRRSNSRSRSSRGSSRHRNSNSNKNVATSVADDHGGEEEEKRNKQKDKDDKRKQQEQDDRDETAAAVILNDKSQVNDDDDDKNCCFIRVFCCNWKKKCWLVWFALLSVTLLALVGAYIGVRVRDDNNLKEDQLQMEQQQDTHTNPQPQDKENSRPIIDPSPGPSEPSMSEEYFVARHADIQAELVRLMGEDYQHVLNGTQQQDVPSPQFEAFEWIVNDDLQQVPVMSVNDNVNGTGADDGGGRLAQRYSLAVLYFSTMTTSSLAGSSTAFNMPDSSWLSNAHECLWEGVTCSPPMPSNNTKANATSSVTIPGLVATALDLKTGRERKHDEVVMKAEKEYRRDRDRHDRRQMLRSRRSLSTATATDTDESYLKLDMKYTVDDAFVEGQATIGRERGDNDTSRVVALDLSDQGLNGIVPLELALLGGQQQQHNYHYLESLDLSRNNLTALDWGSVPLLELFPQLHTLRLNDNLSLEGNLTLDGDGDDMSTSSLLLQEFNIEDTLLNVQIINDGNGGDDEALPFLQELLDYHDGIKNATTISSNETIIGNGTAFEDKYIP